MSEAGIGNKRVLKEAVMLARLNRSDEMREFFIEMWKQNPALAKQGGARVQNLLSAVESKQRGISLIELIIFIVIISVALTGILLVMNQVTAHSADPLVRKQALAVAESILEEVELMPFTYCDPNDASAVTATSTAGCTVPEVLGAEIGETRYSPTTPFDNVNDYHNFQMAAGSIMDITNSNTGLAGYALSPITVTAIDLGGITQASGDALLITVTVSDPAGNDIVLQGIRTRYSPRSVP
ncbi:prepilin-type N-terminal cleavage/methylation domain-containing protein [Sideroxydans sp.]